jgi:hypothetical protein
VSSREFLEEISTGIGEFNKADGLPDSLRWKERGIHPPLFLPECLSGDIASQLLLSLDQN